MGIETALMLTGTALSAAQAFKGLSDQAKADQAAQAARNQAQRVTEQDFSKNLRVPTLGLELAQENIARQQADLTRAAREQGPAGVLGAIPAITQSGIEANLQLASEADRMQAQRNAQQAEMQQGIEQRKAARQYELAGMGLQGAQAASAEARANQMAGLKGGLESLGGLAKLDTYNKYLGADSAKQQYLNSLMDGGIASSLSGFSPQINTMPNYTPNNFSFGGAFGDYMKSKVQ